MLGRNREAKRQVDALCRRETRGARNQEPAILRGDDHASCRSLSSQRRGIAGNAQPVGNAPGDAIDVTLQGRIVLEVVIGVFAHNGMLGYTTTKPIRLPAR